VELGELTRLRELLLNNNYLRNLPFEMGRCYKLQIISLKGNPLPNDFLSLLAEVNGVSKLLTYLLDSLPGMCVALVIVVECDCDANVNYSVS